MATNCLLVARGSDLLLVDTGIGDKHDAHFRDLFGMDPHAVRLPDAIRRAGYEIEQVTHVLLTHLHFDHCGWNTRRAAGDELVPTFPNAVYWLEGGEVEHAVVRLYDGGRGCEPIPGVRALGAPGHNANMCIVLVDGSEGSEGSVGGTGNASGTGGTDGAHGTDGDR